MNQETPPPGVPAVGGAPLNGLMIINKPTGPTSMDVCAMVRARFRRGGAPKRLKVGHAGTLDPMATGVLVVLVGKATPLCNSLMAQRKVYRATIDCAHRSSSDDAQGVIEPVQDLRASPSREEIDHAVRGFVGVIMQRPPAVSAIKVDGRRAYDLAREGKPQELASRPVEVFRFEILRVDWPRMDVVVECGKGTYIRSLARDLGAALGAGGMLTALERTRSGPFDISRARPLASLPDVLEESHLLDPAPYVCWHEGQPLP
ncbi:MAG: tRNA pseudouridine(55) synthase TruB [Phycisphaeraceae bacterium]|nr:tRNA pseudouridine(55) synthase TruB [Phycisphaeraceae bacterium]